MRIRGLQKLTLLDYPGHTACTVFVGGCNYRCPFCHNAGLVLRPEEQQEIPQEEFFEFLESRKGLLDGVVITGGEPTIQPGLTDFMRRVRDFGYDVKLDTNGSCDTVLLADMIDDGLVQYVAMDIKNAPCLYWLTTGIKDEKHRWQYPAEQVWLLKKGFVEYEFRTTVVKEFHRPDDMRKIAKWLSGAERYYIQQFRDSGDLIGPGQYHAYSAEEMRELLDIVREYVPNADLRGVE